MLWQGVFVYDAPSNHLKGITMKHTFFLLAATAAISLTAFGAAANEPAKTQAKAAAKTEANAQAQEPGLFDKVGNWFKNDDAADAKAAHESAKAEPAAGETQQPKARKASQTNANAKRRPSEQTNPALGRVLTEGGAEIGVRTNAKLGQGAAGSYGNN